MKRSVLVALITILIIAFTFGSAWSVYYFFFKPNDNVVPAFSEGGINLVVGGEIVESMDRPVMEDKEVLLPISTIKKYIDPYIYWDKKLKKATITTRDRVIRMKTDSLQAMVNDKPMTLDIPVTQINGTTYIPVSFLSDFYGIEISFYKETNAIVIDFKGKDTRVALPVDSKAVVRTGMSFRYPVIRKFDLENEKKDQMNLRIFGEYEKWYKVRTSTGEVGYIEKKYVSDSTVPAVQAPPAREIKAWKPDSGLIGVVWDQIWTAKKTDFSKMPDMKGLDIISPTWFQLASEDGKLINRADPKYVQWAHSKGYKVWALLNNDFGNEKISSAFLSNTDSRDKLIKELLAYSALYRLDGLNIDFEGLDASDRDNFTQLVRELAPFLREQGLVVSVDINDQEYFDRKALGETADYVAVMAYDQYWSGSTQAGSVAQVPWAEGMLKRYLQSIPPQKILLGMPFYTRLWKEEPKEGEGVKLTSQAISMAAARKLITDNDAPVKWDEDSGQFYSEFVKEGSTYKVWLEDADSVTQRLALVHKYGLAGAAAWSMNFAESSIWPVIEKNLKVVSGYAQWEAENNGENHIYIK